MPKAEPCVSCRRPTPARGRISGQPVCRSCSSTAPKTTTLATIAGSRGKPPKAAQCRICLADEIFTPVGNPMSGDYRSNLKNGRCKDRAACEQRQPPLIPLEKL